MSNSAKLRSDFQRESSSSNSSKSINSSQEKPNHGKKMSQKQTYNSKLRDRIRRYSKGKDYLVIEEIAKTLHNEFPEYKRKKFIV